MDIFVLITQDSVNYPQENDASYVKVMSISSAHVRVTSEGHELSAGQRAYVAADQKDLEKALNKGLVVRLDSQNANVNHGKKKVPSPKARKVSADGAVRQSSEPATTHTSVSKSPAMNELKKKND